MDLLADENVPGPIIARLRQDGVVVFAVIEGQAGIADPEVMKVARDRGLVLMTQDQDFGELAIVRQVLIAGVILLELARLPLDKQVERVAKCLADPDAAWAGYLTVIEPARQRRRALP